MTTHPPTSAHTEQARQAGHGNAVVAATISTLATVTGRPGVVAAVLDTPVPPACEPVLAAVEDGRFVIPRVELAGVDVDTLAAWLDRNLPVAVVPEAARDALCSEVLALGHLAAWLAGDGPLRVRLFTERPTPRCGFHVDTVPPGAPVWGVLRVFNGAGARSVDPTALTSTTDFYRWLHNRDRAVRDNGAAGDGGALAAAVAPFDGCPAFLADPAAVAEVPAGSTVVFRHLPADRHWADHPRDAAWVHASPRTGPARLVVNVSPDRRPAL